MAITTLRLKVTLPLGAWPTAILLYLGVPAKWLVRTKIIDG